MTKTRTNKTIKSKEDLDRIAKRANKQIDTKSSDTIRVVVGMGTCGLAAGGQQIFDTMKEEIDKLGLKNIDLVPTGCVGICQYEPVVEVYTGAGGRTTYVKMTPERAVRVVQQHLRGGNALAQYTIGSKR